MLLRVGHFLTFVSPEMDVKCSHIDHIFNFSRRKQRIQTEFVLQIKTVLAVLAVIMSVPSEAAPPVDKMNPYDPETSSCFFQGRLSLYRKIYNMNTKICLNFYGRLELDPNMEEVELQQIATIEGCLIIHGTKIKVASLRQITSLQPNFERCEYSHALLIYDNPRLTEIEFSGELDVHSTDVFIRLNPKLSKEKVTGASFKVDIGDKTDCLVSSAEKNRKCKRIIGDVNFDQLSSDTWERIEEVHGTVQIKNTQAEHLYRMQDLKIFGWKSPALVISDNENLVDIAALLSMEISAEGKALLISNNPNICHNVVERKQLQDWLKKMKVTVTFNEKCLKSCAGGRISYGYLAGLDKQCNTIEGNLIIEKLQKLPDEITKLQQLEKIHGRIIVTNNDGITELSFLENIKEIQTRDKNDRYSLLIYGNANLRGIQFSKDLHIDKSEVFIRANPRLSRDGVKGASFRVDVGTSTDCLANAADGNRYCTMAIGDIKYGELSTSTWQRLQTVEGSVSIENADVVNLDAMKNLTIVAWKTPALTIVRNEKLADIGALLTINVVSKKASVKIKNNPNICHNIAERKKLEQWLKKNGAYSRFSDKCLKSCVGGQVTQSYLAQLDKHCNAIDGHLTISGLGVLPTDIAKLEQVEKIDGRVLITNNKAIEKLDFFKNLKELTNTKDDEYKHNLMIYGNENLKEIEFSENFRLDPRVVLIRVNPKLTSEGMKKSNLKVDIGDSSDCLASAAEKNRECRALVGDINFNDLSANAWKRIQTVEGTVSVVNSNAETLDSLRHLHIAGWKAPALIVTNNRKLIDIYALTTMDIESKAPQLKVKDNPYICHNVAERKLLEKWLLQRQSTVEFSNRCLKSCPGGTVSPTYLANLHKHCNVINGNLMITGITKNNAGLNMGSWWRNKRANVIP
ncbi:hypothetical protein Y032_0212g2231 [Ancylostoma ceylanicum]|uniref:Receptor L-domain domain-containing protein n=2 Tax=Ancylostoma ceylanicum TaxID=53326 RepID=A0A016SKR7_9BILA|nr:hypothetical protein Y032_0212g2231 [Ancylostoma ceylanicum]